jgi:hypothetical protein
MKKNVYKLIPFTIVVIVALVMCCNRDEYSFVSIILFGNIPAGLPSETATEINTITVKSIFSGIFFVVPIIILGFLGAFLVKKCIERKKLHSVLLFIVWLVLFFFWFFWLSMITRAFPVIDPLSTI